MGDVIIGLITAAVFTGVILGLAYGAVALIHRAVTSSARQGNAAVNRDTWETATTADDAGTVQVALRRVADRGHGPEELEHVTVGQISPDSGTWTEEVLAAQAEADQRLAAIQKGNQRGRHRR